jgi:hypothetical protein
MVERWVLKMFCLLNLAEAVLYSVSEAYLLQRDSFNMEHCLLLEQSHKSRLPVTHYVKELHLK